MKISPQNQKIIIDDIVAIYHAKATGELKIALDNSINNETCFSALHWLRHRAYADRRHDDNHPRFSDGIVHIIAHDTDKLLRIENRKADVRILAFKSEHEMYTDGSNDTHIKTVLKRAREQLQKIT